MKKLVAQLLEKKGKKQKSLAILIDPDQCKMGRVNELLELCKKFPVDYFFVGGSLLVEDRVGPCIQSIKSQSETPVVLFPGNVYQLHPSADALMYLSLLSGRNAEFLIGKQVEAALMVAHSTLEVIATAYLLIDGGSSNTAAYLSQTQPIPRDKAELALATAMAAKHLNFHWIYLEAGSGARFPVPKEIIHRIAQHIDVPLIAGGGIRTVEQMEMAFEAGADVVVIGNAAEENPHLIEEFSWSLQAYNQKMAKASC